MKSREIADRYAEALYELGIEEQILDELGQNLRDIKSLVLKVPQLQLFIDHPLIPVEQKRELVKKIFEDKINPLTVRFLYLLLDKSRGDYLELICQRFFRIRSEREDVVEVTVYVPEVFSEDIDDVKEMVENRLERILDKEVGIREVKKDSDLIGGMRLEVGNKIVDGSVRYRLEQLREFVLEGD